MYESDLGLISNNIMIVRGMAKCFEAHADWCGAPGPLWVIFFLAMFLQQLQH